MQKNVLIALAIIGTLTAGFFFTRNKPTTVSVGTQTEDLKVTKTVGTQTSALKDIYNQWKVNYNVHVGAAEDSYRFKVFSSNYFKIQRHNRLLGKSYNLGLNPFTHLTQEEFAATHLGLKFPNKVVSENVTVLPTDNLQTKVDWTAKMNAVRDQGMCGSCWAFSAVGALEGAHSVKKGNLFQLSEQELVDCSGSFGNQGCNGGLMDQAFQYVIQNGGLATRTEYPYTAADGQCKNGLSKNAPITSFVDVTPNSSAALKAAIAQQPVSVAIEADTFAFQGYTSGVMNDASCGTNIDHGVVAVGYNDETSDAEGSIPYYKVRNSWGASWGEAGHIRIGIQDGAGICGIQTAASYPVA